MNLNPKVKAGGAAGAVATIAVFVAGQFGLQVPAGVEAAVAVLVATLAGYIKTA